MNEDCDACSVLGRTCAEHRPNGPQPGKEPTLGRPNQLGTRAETHQLPKKQHNYELLEEIVKSMQGPPGWEFELRDEDGAKRFVVILTTKSNYPPHRPFRVAHFHPCPVAVYNEKSWRRWLFDQCIRTMHHELGEGIRFNEEHPFAPCHGPGENPYDIHDNRSGIERRTLQDGSVKQYR